MVTYVKLVDYAAKDLLLHGDPAKAGKGTEVGAEFDAIAAADATNVKTDGGNQTIAGIKTFSSTIVGSVSGNAETVTVADAAADTTTWPLLGTSQTGSLAPATDAGLTYDASTNVLTSGEFRANGASGGLEVSNSNTTDNYQITVAGSMTLDTATLSVIPVSTTVTGGATLSNARGLILNITYTPTANTAIQNFYNQFTLNTGVSPVNTYGQLQTFILGASALGGTITNYYGNQVSFSPNASATTNITTWSSYNAANIANGTAMTVTNAYGFRGQMTSGSGRYNCYMDGTAPNYFAGDLQLSKTITPGGTTGAQTINKTSGSVNFAAAATSLVVTNNLVTTSSVILCMVATNDATMKTVLAVAAAGSFTIYANAAATAETRVNFLVTN